MSPAARMLIEALSTKAGAACNANVQSTPWHSATFAGERHVIMLTFEDMKTAQRLVTGLVDHEFACRGVLVADLVAGRPTWCGKQVRVNVEALTLAEA